MLNADQRRTYEEQGFLLLTDWFTASESDALLAETARLSGEDMPQRILEADGETVRSVYWVHGLSDLFGRLVRDRRSVEPARDLLGGDVYVYQTQLNPKAPLRGDSWEWHQDYVFWARDDGMPRPDALNVAVFLDDVTEFNGPMFLIPGSHREARSDDTATVAEGWANTLTADLRHKVELPALARMVGSRGIASARGPKGTVLVFDSRLLHASQPNLTPFPRTVLFIRYASVDNVLRPVPEPRPEWLACRNPEAVRPLDEPLLAGAANGR
jgi:ectoine hydroxylase